MGHQSRPQIGPPAKKVNPGLGTIGLVSATLGIRFRLQYDMSGSHTQRFRIKYGQFDGCLFFIRTEQAGDEWFSVFTRRLWKIRFCVPRLQSALIQMVGHFIRLTFVQEKLIHFS